MNIPAYTSPTLCIGRTYDAEKATASSDVFPTDIPIKQINVNKFSFKYTVVKNSKDVQDLLDVSGEISLKIKANLLRVEGAGQYINDIKNEEGTTTLLAVMKCTTVTETIDGRVEPVENPGATGTHYVRSITYGAELVAKLKFKTMSRTKKEDIQGRAEGELNLQVISVGLKAELQKLTTECETASDLEVNYYSTGLPDKLPITIEGLTQLIETFPSRMKDINDGKGIPIKFELLPVTNIIPTAKAYLLDRVQAYELEEIENCFDDLRSALELANAFRMSANEQHDDVDMFISDTKKVEKIFRKAISALGKSEEKKQLEASQEAYENALGGLCVDGKFVQQWKKIYRTKKPTTSIELENLDKPSAHIEADNKKDVTYPENTVIKDWSVGAPHSHLAGGMKYADGKLTVPTPGRYYIYAQVYFHNTGRIHMNVNNNVISMIQPPTGGTDQGTLYAGVVFNLKAGDVITLTAHEYYPASPAIIYMDTSHSYFGAFLM